MKRRGMTVAALVLAWPLAGAAADLDARAPEPYGWRATARLAATPLCDVFRAGIVTDDRYRAYKDLERDILLARKAMNERYAEASPYLDQLMPGDFVRSCR